MRVKKIFNLNAILIDNDGEEQIALGSGIGFNKKKNDLIFERDIERLFISSENNTKLAQLLSQIDASVFEASETIIDYAESFLKTNLNDHIHISLADHIAFAIDRIKNGILMQNQLLREIKALYPEEFLISEWALHYLKDKFEMEFPIDEAAYISIHLHSARQGQISTKKSIREVTIISAILELISDYLEIDFNDISKRLDYTRLVTHLRFVLERVHQNKFHSIDEDVMELIKTKYSDSYQLALKIQKMVLVNYGQTIPNAELGYITLHIERLASESE